MDDREIEQIEIFKVKKLIKSLKNSHGNGTSMISLFIPPGSQISRVNKMLTEEYGKSSNIKSRVNRTSVLGALISTQQRLKLYSKCPKNGLIIYCGNVLTDDGKGKRVSIDFEPFKPISTFLYHCDSKFHTDFLKELLIDDEVFGFIVMDGNGCLYGTVQGSNRETLHKFSVDLPKKHGRGGQSALRFARLRLEKRQNYVRKVAELANKLFVPNGQKPNVRGIILAGSANFKSELMRSDLFNQHLSKIVLKMVDVSYGGDHGFQQAIELATDTLGSVKLMKEKKLLQSYMDEISQDTGKYCFTVKGTFKALELGAVKDLIIWENLDVDRIVLRNTSTSEETIAYLTKEEQTNEKIFHDKETGVELEVLEIESLVEWFANNYKQYGCNLELVSDCSGEGTKFVRGFGGIGGTLRWKVDFVQLNACGDLHEFNLDCDSDCSSDNDNVNDHDEYGFDDGDFGF